ncbi:hypothetical protein MM221_16205 [Salipaludibacillus sp. LMS25]|nr:hypothetical protein [Salipaludibacillus sp. LMS25]UTR14108.1 hypothetical protein MM221_16205 [Salipaludibacillus sp. LMS25]
MEKFTARICGKQVFAKKAFKVWGALRFTVGDNIFSLIGKTTKMNLSSP